MKNKVFSTRMIIYVAILGSLATLLMFFEIPIFPMAPFLKIDFSDVITIIGGIIFGPVSGTLIAMIKSILNWIIKGAGIINLLGNFAGFIGSLSVLFPIVLIKNKNIFLKIIISIISLTFFSALINYLVLLPAYMKLMGMKLNVSILNYVLTIIVPFNLIKGVIITTVSYVVYLKMKNYIKNNNLK